MSFVETLRLHRLDMYDVVDRGTIWAREAALHCYRGRAGESAREGEDRRREGARWEAIGEACWLACLAVDATR